MLWIMYTTTYDNNTGYECRIYFTALSLNPLSWHNFSYQIWESDGTPNGTQLLKSPQPCPEGFYCTLKTSTNDPTIDYLQGSQIFDTVQNQTTLYQQHTNLTVDDLPYYPMLCWNGYYCPAGSMNPRGYGACPTGYYCPGTLTSSHPIICAQGTLCPGFGNRDYYECMPGTWSNHTRQSLCETCPIGYVCEGGDDLPSICPAGFVCSQPALAEPDRLCPACFYCLPGTNTYKTNVTRVISGYATIIHETDAITPILCEAGYYCGPGTATSANYSVRYDRTTPQICTKGFYCGAGSCDAKGTGRCAPGEFCAEGSIQPNITQPGYYNPHFAMSTEWICLPGTYANCSNMDYCDICPPGYECVNGGTIVPDICDRGYFREDLDSIECARCPDGTYSNSTGLGAESECILCKPGWVCGSPGLTQHPTSLHFLCPQGFVCGNGTNLYESRVTLCPGGFYCGVGTTPYSKLDTPCLAGYFCPNGTSDLSMSDNICPEGYYCPSHSYSGVHVQLPCYDSDHILYNADCEAFKCPQGTTTSTSATSLVQCELNCIAPLCTTLNRTNPIHETIGYNNLTFNSGSILILDIDWSHIPVYLMYYKHFVMNIYYVPSNESIVRINDTHRYLVDTLDDSGSKEPYLYPIGEWFKQRDDTIQHKRRFKLNLFFNTGKIDVFIRVEIIHGTYRHLTHLFQNTVNISVFQPSRFAKTSSGNNDNPAIYAVIKKEDVVDQASGLPFNLITNSSFESITVDLISDADISISDMYQDPQEWDLFHDEFFFEFGYQGSDTRDMLVFAWFPYWSNCLDFESRLYINYMLEGGYDDNNDKNNSCKIYDKESELKPVYSYDFMKNPVTDYCNFNITCQYEENVGLHMRKRWWELPVGTTIFYLTREAHKNKEYETGWTAFSELFHKKVRFIPVTISKSTQEVTDQNQIPTIVTLNIFYYQKDVDTKILIETYLEYDGWKDVPVDETTQMLVIDSFYENGSVLTANGDVFDLRYKLQINYQAVGYMDILNDLHFDIFPIYILLYLTVGIGCVIFMFLIWSFKRICVTKLKHAPGLNLTHLSWLYVQPLISGYLLSLVPTIMVILVLYSLYLVEYPFSDIPGKYTDVEELLPTRIEKYRAGRLGYSMILFGLYFVHNGAMMLIPCKSAPDIPIKWKRSWLMMAALTIALFFVYLQQFSYSDIYMNNNNITYFVIFFKFIHLIIYLLLERWFKSSLITSPFIVAMTCIQFIIIMASKTIISFLMNFMTLYLLQFVEKMYILPFLKSIIKLIPVYNARIQSQIYHNLGQRSESERFGQYAQDLRDEIDSRTIEPMIENINKTANDILAYLIIPFILYFFNTFYSDLKITTSWNIDEYDIDYYLIFTLIIIIFLILSDLILFNAQEIYHSWPIYKYLKFCRHRFVTRIKHWKFFEFEAYDETLDPILRDLDLLCFSSQFYFISSITSFGILFIYLGFTVTLANEYPFMSDSFFFILTMFGIFTCMLSRRILIYLFKLTQIWKIAHLPIIHYAVDEDETPYDPMQHLRSKPVQNKFLEKNKRWLVENLQELITPDALERHRDYLMYHYESLLREKNAGKLQNKYDISDDDLSDMDANNYNNKAIKLNKRQERIAIWWLDRGKRFSEMKRLVDGIIASNLENNCNECGSNENLQIQQFISIEDLVYEYDKKVKLGIDRMDKMHPVISWRQFFSKTQLFRTLCAMCLANVRIKNINNKDVTLISDDSESDKSDEYDWRYQQFQASFNKISKNIAALWLQGARRRMLSQNVPSIPSLSLSLSSDHSPQTTEDSIMQNNNVPILRDDISSITETSATQSSNQSKHYAPQRDDISDNTASDISDNSSSAHSRNNQRVIRRDDISSDSESDDDD